MASIRFNFKNPEIKEESGKIYFTYDDLIRLPEWPEEPLIEIIDGDLFVVFSPTIKHQEISQKFFDILKTEVSNKNLGKLLYTPVDVILSQKDTVILDLIFISNKNMDKIKEKFIEGIPDLIIEILSTKRKRDLEEKYNLYQKYDVKEYLIIDCQNRKFHYNMLEDGKYQIKIYEEDDIFELKCIPNIH